MSALAQIQLNVDVRITKLEPRDLVSSTEIVSFRPETMCKTVTFENSQNRMLMKS